MLKSNRLVTGATAFGVAVLVSVPGVVVVTTIVILALAALARSPSLHVMVPPFGALVDRAQVPWLEATELK